MFNGEYIKPQKVEEEVYYTHVQIQDVKDQVNLMKEETEHDEFLQKKIEAAYGDARDYTGHCFAKTFVKYESFNFNKSSVYFHLTPLIGIQRIRTSTDRSSWVDLIEWTDFMIKKDVNGFEILFANTVESTFVEFEFLIGYDIGELPDQAHAAIVLKAGDMFDVERSNYAPQKTANTNAYHDLINGFVKVRKYDSE